MTDGLESSGTPVALDDAPAEEASPPPRPRWPGSVAAAIAVVMVVTWAVALAVSTAGMLTLGTWLSIAANVLTVPAVVLGLIAAITDRGRGWGVVAVVIGILLNPVVLLHGLTWIGAL